MKPLKNKTATIRAQMAAIMQSLFFQALPEENRRDFYTAVDAMKVWADNIPDKMPKSTVAQKNWEE